MPTVSVIVPTHNRPHFLRQAIQSILAQSYSDLEAIVVDDGSEDNTQETVSSFADSRIRYIHQEQAGRSIARNRGLDESQSEYIAFLDDDDLFFPHKIESQLRFLEDNSDYDLVNAGVWYMNSQNGLLGISAPWLSEESISLQSALYSVRMTTQSVLFRRTVLEKMHQWFDPDLDLCEDADFFIRSLQNGCQVAIMKDFVGAYRLHSSNSPSGGAEFAQAYGKVLDKTFRSPDLPRAVLEDRDRVYTHYHLVASCRAYATRDATNAKKFLQEATEIEPNLVENKLPEVMARFAGFCGSNPRPYVEFVLSNLPQSLSHYRDFKREIYRRVLENQVTMERELQVFASTWPGESLFREYPKVDDLIGKAVGCPASLEIGVQGLPDSAFGGART